ncbi:hypothetical protein KC865_01535 [Candidatus Kaiserbacteria bacterium]|nr:hypothetical protein [Candidatus Kaiserbacteria bacterium]
MCWSEVASIEQQIKKYVEDKTNPPQKSALERWSESFTGWVINSKVRLPLCYVIVLSTAFVSSFYFNKLIVDGHRHSSMIFIISLIISYVILMLPFWVTLIFSSKRYKQGIVSEKNYRTEWLKQHPREAVMLRLIEANEPNR